MVEAGRVELPSETPSTPAAAPPSTAAAAPPSPAAAPAAGQEAEAHPWTRYVAIGDSFTEGIGDPNPQSPGGHRGWADRVAEELARTRAEAEAASRPPGRSREG